MSIDTAAPPATPPGRPAVSDVEQSPTGKSFRLQFDPGQRLPAHRNPSRIVITVVRGDGTMVADGFGPRVLREGEFVQLDAHVAHGVVAGERGLELLVAVTQNCCGSC